MSRDAGERYECKECGAVLVYEKDCPCNRPDQHQEVCCGSQMTKV